MNYQIDFAHSNIGFSVRHMMITKVRGQFDKFSGEVSLDEQNPENTTVHIVIDASSINTREGQRDAHLSSPDFLDTAQYPELIFDSRRVEVLDETHAILTGDLTIRGVTKEVSMDVDFSGKATSPWGSVQYGFTGHTVINRKDWGLTWNKALETGGMLVGEDITIDIELELIQVPETEAAAK
jgi:polyisoprenoid-binding protein YceI